MNDPLISCLCVTRNRVPMLKRAVSCFQHQTYPHRELVIIYEADDPETREYLAGIDSPMIRLLEVSTAPKLSLGALRNISIEFSQGRYLAQWDDDDWHGPTRLAEQMAAIRQSGRPVCVLMRWILFDEVTKKAFLSASRAWEGSILAARDALPKYPELSKGEDTVVIEQLLSEKKLTGLDKAHLYIYTYHGSNTWERSHWEQKILPSSQPLDIESQEQVRRVLEIEGGHH
jgi:glycosyltransferase involved in cell wall biosynthesis